jgi:hypothetical protein
MLTASMLATMFNKMGRQSYTAREIADYLHGNKLIPEAITPKGTGNFSRQVERTIKELTNCHWVRSTTFHVLSYVKVDDPTKPCFSKPLEFKQQVLAPDQIAFLHQSEVKLQDWESDCVKPKKVDSLPVIGSLGVNGQLLTEIICHTTPDGYEVKLTYKK